jgi:GNAT superfamily N-acetyltransferase
MLGWELLNDVIFLQELTDESPEWKEIEWKHVSSVSELIKKYEHVNGQWRIWKDEGLPIAVTFTVEKAASNGKPWIGSILVTKKYRHRGYGKKIIQMLSDEFAAKRYDVLYCAVPLQMEGWISFLSKCFFDQYKIEKDTDGTN